MTRWSIERLASADEVDVLLAIEEASFSNPWTHEMYVAEMANQDVAFFYVARDAAGTIVGFCSLWRILDELQHQQPGRRACSIGAPGSGVPKRC